MWPLLDDNVPFLQSIQIFNRHFSISRISSRDNGSSSSRLCTYVENGVDGFADFH